MTEKWKLSEAFASWCYAKYFTHVPFFNGHTFHFIAEKG